MKRASIFMPLKPSKQYPLVVALPGMVAEDESTRMDSIIEELRKRSNAIGIRLNYVKREERANSLAYTFDMALTAQDIGTVVNMALTELGADPNRIGLISNSISAFPATKYLIENQNLNRQQKIKCYASISPLLGWAYFANRELREYIEKRNIDLVINGDNGNTNAKQKIIPKEMIPVMIGMDGLNDLRTYQPNGMEVMTLLGNRDRKADPESMKRYHFLLGGKRENLVCLDTNHNVPDSNEYIIKFMAKHLSAGQINP